MITIISRHKNCIPNLYIYDIPKEYEYNYIMISIKNYIPNNNNYNNKNVYSNIYIF